MFGDRLIGFFIGLVIGLILGYVVRYLREIKEKVDEVDEIVKHDHTPNERGAGSLFTVSNVALFIVVLVTLFAAISSQRTSNSVQKTQDNVANVTACNRQFLSKTIDALNERTTYTLAQARTNVQLQKAQARFLSIFINAPKENVKLRDEALKEYFKKVTEFVMLSEKTKDKLEENPYPTNKEVLECLTLNS